MASRARSDAAREDVPGRRWLREIDGIRHTRRSLNFAFFISTRSLPRRGVERSQEAVGLASLTRGPATVQSAPRGKAASSAAGEPDGEVVLIEGIQGSVESRQRQGTRGARLPPAQTRQARQLAGEELDQRLKPGDRNFVLDNTYVSRAQRNRVVEIRRLRGCGRIFRQRTYWFMRGVSS